MRKEETRQLLSGGDIQFSIYKTQKYQQRFFFLIIGQFSKMAAYKSYI